MYIYRYLRILLVSMVCAAEVASWALQIEMVVHLGIRFFINKHFLFKLGLQKCMLFGICK